MFQNHTVLGILKLKKQTKCFNKNKTIDEEDEEEDDEEGDEEDVKEADEEADEEAGEEAGEEVDEEDDEEDDETKSRFFAKNFELGAPLRLSAREETKSHRLHLFDFSPLCISKCLLKLAAIEDEKSHWLHFFLLFSIVRF